MRRIAALSVAGLVLVLLVVAQLVLPGIAAQQLRDRLARSGDVLSVEVKAFPAIELLWHQADHVVVRLGQYRSSTGHLGSLLSQTADVGSLDASASVLDAGLLTLRDATLHKRGNQLTGSARVTEADLRAAVPFLDAVQPVASGNGQLILRGTATLLGVTASVDATVGAYNGQLVVQPNVPFGALATVTVFSNPQVRVQGVSASGTAGGFAVAAQAKLS
jgi:hypothetical protein